jgi:transposase
VRNRLAKKQRSTLQYSHRQESSARYADRIKTILLLDSGWPIYKISEALLLDPNTVRRYQKLYEEGGIELLCSDNYTGRECSLSEEEQDELKSELKRKIYLTTAEIISFVKSAFKIEYSAGGMVNLLHRIGFSYKKPNLVPGKANEAAQREFLKKMDDLKSTKNREDKLLFMDGVHPQHNSLPAYGWLPKGEETKLKSNTGRQRANLSGALDSETHEVIVYEHKTLNAEATILFFRILERRYSDAPMIYIILDNAGYYKGEKIREYLKNSRIKLVFLPPYAPNLNLIERLWKFFKKQVLYNQYYETFSEFRDACLKFFHKKNLRKYKCQLDSLLTDNFQIVSAKTRC